MENDELETKWRAEVQPLACLPFSEQHEQAIDLFYPSERLAYYFNKLEVKIIADLLEKSLIDFAQQPGMLNETLREIQTKLSTLDLSLKDSVQFNVDEHPAVCMQPIENAYQFCIEFVAPVKSSQLPATYKNSLTPWIKQFIGLSSKEITTLLRQEWAHLQSNDARKLRDYFLSLTPSGIASDTDGSWLVFKDQQNSSTPTLFLKSPETLNDEEKKFLAAFNIDSLEECASTFPQCHEHDLWDNSLTFWCEPHSDIDFLGKSSKSYPEDQLSDWEDGMHIYTIYSGDILLLGKDGRVAQAQHELVWAGRVSEGTVHVLNTFSDFVDYYIRYLKDPSDDSISPLFCGDYSGDLKLI